jgi:hypothetical protein
MLKAHGFGTGSGFTGDLRYCVTNATSGSDTIVFAAGLTGTIQLEDALPTLNASVSIQGPWADQLTIAGGDVSYPTYGIFSVSSSAKVQISGLTLTDADEAIDNAGSIVINNCTLDTNDGALFNTGSATITNSTLYNNSYSSDAVYPNDGAVCNTGTLTVSDSTLSGNSTVAISNNGSATVSNSTLDDNDGGAITNDLSLTVNNSTLSNNDSRGSGAIGNGGSATVNNSTLSGNRGVDGGAISNSGNLTVNNRSDFDLRMLDMAGQIGDPGQGQDSAKKRMSVIVNCDPTFVFFRAEWGIMVVEFSWAWLRMKASADSRWASSELNSCSSPSSVDLRA